MKQTLYILHGWAIDSANEKKWEKFLQLLQKQEISSVFLPIPGLSTELNEVWNLDSYVSWLKNELPKNEQIILLGHSFGGQIACQFAAQYPHLVSKLILIDSAGIIDKSTVKIVKRLVFKTVARLGKPIFNHDFFRNVLYKLAREKDYLKANKTLRQTMANVISTEVLEFLDQIECPTLIIWGQNDTITPVRFAKVFKERITKSEMKIVAGARHSPQFTHPDETAEIIGEFLK